MFLILTGLILIDFICENWHTRSENMNLPAESQKADSQQDVNVLALLPQALLVLQLIDGGISEREVAAKFKDRERAEALIHFLKKSELLEESKSKLVASDTGRYFLHEYGIV